MEPDNESADNTAPSTKSPVQTVFKLVLLLVVGVCVFFLYQNFGDFLTLKSLASKETLLREYQANHPLLVYGIAFLIYVIVTGLSLPGAAILTLVFGWYFGFLRALILVSFASTSGATVAFLLSRYLLRDFVQNRFGEKLTSFNKALEREGAFYLFSLRLIPAVPFFLVNNLMGPTPLKTSTYWWVSQLGMLPGTAAYVYVGSELPDLQELADKGAGGILKPQLLVAFAILGLLPLAFKKILPRLASQPTAENADDNEEEICGRD